MHDRGRGDNGERGTQGPDLGTRQEAQSVGLAEVEQHAFNSAVRDSFAEATDISDVRAMEYGDTWAVERMRDGLLGLTLSLPQPPHLHKEFIRLVRCAVMVDVKDSRMAGPWKDDSLLDQINYGAAYLQWRAAYTLAIVPFDDAAIPMPSEGMTHGTYSRTGGTTCPGCAECAG